MTTADVPGTPAGPGDTGIRVYLVDDHALFRSGVRAELDRGDGRSPVLEVVRVRGLRGGGPVRHRCSGPRAAARGRSRRAAGRGRSRRR